MTCIIGCIRNNELWMGADSLMSQGDRRILDPVEKMRRIKGPNGIEALIALAGDFCEAQVILECLTLPEYESIDTPFSYLIKKFLPELKEVLQVYGMLKKENEIETSSIWVIMGLKNRLFGIDFDFAVIEFKEFCTQGSGADVAAGAMLALSKDMHPEERIRRALEITDELMINVGGPYHIEKL